MTILAGLLALAVGACGIQPDGSARSIQPPPGPYQLRTAPPPPVDPSGPISERLFFVRNGKLVAVERKVSGTRTAQQSMADLLAGPTDDETGDGLSSALPGNNVIGGVSVSDGVATVNLGSGLEGTGRNDGVLAFGQVVLTLDARPDVTGVVFQQGGQRLGVPRADGVLSAAPLTAADYASLAS
jgi:hypothetical protein